ncbi:MAG: hypothetical protein HZC24_08300 [Rhodocyclales bacterium]|nr:hypothetical protein [Rhodocyclales bacterium]
MSASAEVGVDAERIAAFYAQAPGATPTNLSLTILAVIVMSERMRAAATSDATSAGVTGRTDVPWPCSPRD